MNHRDIPPSPAPAPTFPLIESPKKARALSDCAKLRAELYTALAEAESHRARAFELLATFGEKASENAIALSEIKAALDKLEAEVAATLATAEQ